jgi:hypothetical protein
VQTLTLGDQIALLRTLVKEMGATIADLRRREDDLKADRDAWREAHSASQRLLPKPMPEDAQAHGRGGADWPADAYRLRPVLAPSTVEQTAEAARIPPNSPTISRLAVG